MTIIEFEALSSEAQVGYMLQQGICIADHVTRLCHLFLFQVASFYVEVCHDLSSSEVLDIRILASTDGLDIYLEETDISELTSFC